MNDDDDEFCVVTTHKEDAVTPQVLSLHGILCKLTAILFEADKNREWPSGLEVIHNLWTVKVGKSNSVGAEIQQSIILNVRDGQLWVVFSLFN